MNFLGKRLRLGAWCLAGLFLAGSLGAFPAWADEKKKSRFPQSPKSDGVPSMPEAWKTAPRTPVTPADIDRLLANARAKDRLTPAPRTTDEQFVRRATLDLTGRLPVPADVDEFCADRDPHKRAKLIDRLLASDEYAQHWARYWRDVIIARATAQQVFLRPVRTVGLETWLTEQFKANRSWGDIARAMITAEGPATYDNIGENGAAGFLLCHFGQGSDNERAAETARVFMGIQIQCAQCHDHPFDIWKRNQFHELAAFFSRTRERPMRDGPRGRFLGINLFSGFGGEHRMPHLDDPKQSTTINPRFLLGQTIPPGQSDLQRRRALADMITSKDDYWFAAAYVNRIWGELMGQAFYQPVDDMGPLKEAVLPDVLIRLASSFRAEDYNPKALFREIMNSEAYQRQTRLGETSDQHLMFAAAYPTRLRADALWESLVNVLGAMKDPPRRGGPRAGGQFAGIAALLGRFQGFEAQFKREFDFDPSTKPDDVEGSIPQALLLMNNPRINERIEAHGTNLLARILKAYPEDKDALRILYLRTLARKPTDKELEKCSKYLAKVGNRTEAFEDLLWALINSTEFQTKR